MRGTVRCLLSPNSGLDGTDFAIATAGDLTFFFSAAARGFAKGGNVLKATRLEKAGATLSIGSNVAGFGWNAYRSHQNGELSGANLGDGVLRLALIGLEIKGYKAAKKGLGESAATRLASKIGDGGVRAAKKKIVNSQGRRIGRYHAHNACNPWALP